MTWLVPVAAIILMWVALLMHNNDQLAQALRTSQVTTSNLARAFEESLVRSIREIDQTLLYVRALRARDGAALDLRPWIEGADPENRLAAQIAMADREGLVTFSNLKPMMTRIDLSDRAHFRHFADAPDDHLFISVPVLGRISGLWTLQFVRMLKTPSGAFDGIIVLSVSPNDLTRFYKAVDLGRDGRIAMIGLDGIYRARVGGNPIEDGRVIGTRANGPAVALAATQPSGPIRWTDPADGVARIASYRRIHGQPFVLLVSMSEREIYAGLDGDASRNILGALAMTGMVIGLTLRAAGQRNRAARAQQLVKIALEHVGVGVMVIDPGGRIAMFNARTAALLDLPDDFQPGFTETDLRAWQRRHGRFADWDIGTDRTDAQPVLLHQTMADGKIIEARTEALDDGTAVCSFTDMTEPIQQQRTLTEARDAAEAAVRARAQFLAAMSHEIRTPLNGILGAADLMRARPLPDDQREYADIIHQAGSHLLEMLTEILDYSKIDERGVELEVVTYAPGKIVCEVVEVLTSRATPQGVTLTTAIAAELPAFVVGDPHRLRQILFNLIGNAIKFTAEFGQIDIGLQARPHNDGWWLDGSVRDTGIGISPAAQAGLFTEFTQSDGSITRRFGGTGLGLAICRRLVEAMGGAISVESTLGAGSCFAFSILVGATTQPPELIIRLGLGNGDGLIAARAPMVLIAEDTQVNRLVATHMLERLGCRVQAVVNGREAVAAVRAGGIDLVLMDIMMPEMDGLAATRAIRALAEPLGAIPIIGLSANAFRSDEEAGRAAGMNGFATKPINSDRLAAELTAALGLGEVEATVTKPTALDDLRAALGDAAVEAVIAAFRDDTPATLSQLRRDAQACNLAGVAQAAHALAGNAATLGLVRLADAALRTEREARHTNGPTPDRLDLLETEFAAALAALHPEPVG